MKSFLICTVAGGLAFTFMAFQLGLFDEQPADGTETSAVAAQEKPKEAPKRARFPKDLAPAARAQAVAQASAFNADSKYFPMIFLKSTGAVHEAWQDKLNDGWAPDTVEKTQLAVVLGPNRKVFLDKTDYPNYPGSPPIFRYKFELEVSVIEAKTGKVLANRNFVNLPRSIREWEPWELCEIGTPVAYKTVFGWVVSSARAGFPEVSSPDPIITVIE